MKRLVVAFLSFLIFASTAFVGTPFGLSDEDYTFLTTPKIETVEKATIDDILDILTPEAWAGIIIQRDGGSSCSLYQSNTGEDASLDSVGDGAAETANATYVGDRNYTVAANATVCQVDIDIESIEGYTSGINWQIEIKTWNSSSYDFDGTPSGTCTSNTQEITTTGWKQFTGLSCQLTTSDDYCIVLTRSDHSYSGTNFIVPYASTTQGTSPGDKVTWWNASGEYNTAATGYWMSIKVYTQ